MSRNPETVTCEMNIEHVPRVPIVIVSSLSRKCCPPSDLVCAENSYSSMSSTNFHSPLVQPGGLSEKSRTLSANTLRDRLSKLATPLNPVAALHANIKCVFFIARYYLSYQIDLFYFILFHFSFCSFVPAQIPRKRRLQMLAVAVWSVMIVITTCAWLLLWYVYHFSGTSFSTPLCRVLCCDAWMTISQLTTSPI